MKINIYNKIKKVYKNMQKKRRLKGKYKFESRKKDFSKLCIIIAGYKPFLYSTIFKRIEKFIPKDIEVCIVSSGKYDKDLSKIAEDNEWSYLSTKRNCVSLAQNIVIKLFDKAEYIYKLDEDIFVTKGYFETLYKTYKDCENNGDYQVGIVAPTIPINGYGNLNILKRFNMEKLYTEKFERPKYAAGRNRKIESDPNVAKFMWGENEYLPTIDEMNYQMSNDEFSYNACPIRFSIGAILFRRKLWEDMHYFEVKRGNCLGIDEEQICSFCMISSRAIIVSNNTVVGHLSFGTQNEEMKKYFITNITKFEI